MGEAKILSRDAVLGAQDLKREIVLVPEWGGAVYVSTMTGAGRDAWEQSLVSSGKDGKGKVDLQNVRARLLAYTVAGEDGKLLFTEADIEALGQKSSAALDRCVKVAQRLNRLTDKAMEESLGN